MAGPLDIQRAPRGLLDWLSLKGSGRTPVTLQDSIQLSVDASYVYLQDQFRTHDSIINPVAAGFNSPASYTVPAGILWIVVNASGLVSNGAANSNTLQWAYKRQNAVGFWARALVEAVATPINTSAWVGGPIPPWQLILSPGDQLGLYASAVTGAAGTITTHIECYELGI